MKSRAEKNKKIQKELTREEHQKKIKKFLKITSFILLIIFSILSYGIFIGAKVIIVKEEKITTSLIPSQFHGIKIVHFSDILYNSFNENDLNKLKTKINELEADIIIFTGGIKRENYTLTKENIELLEDFFNEINASIKKYAVSSPVDDESFQVIMENSNFSILNNKSELIYYKENNPIKIIGINSQDINLDAIKNEDYYNICMLSNPDKINDVLKNVNCNLAFAGNTLGGEIKIPFYKGIFDNHTYSKSYYEINDTSLYISNGIGNNINMRLFNHPTISLYRLTKY